MADRIRALARALRAEPALGQGLRPWIGLAVALGLAGLLSARLSALDTLALRQAFAAIAPGAWLAALALTAISFAAVGGHDETLHRHLGTGVGAATARRAGVAAIALSQMAGFGLVTGALVRWRMLPGQSLAQAGRLTLLVSLAFLAGWGVVAAGLMLTLGPVALRPWAWAGLAAMTAIVAHSLFGRSPARPSLRTLCRVVVLAAVDVLAAALAFWVLLPVPLALDQALPAIVLAIGAGLISGAPGGLGAFELTLLAALPGVPEAPVLAAVLAWRAVYFALPALAAAALALRGPQAGATLTAVPMAPAEPAFAEAGLMRQGGFRPLRTGGLVWAVADLGQTRVHLRAPLARRLRGQEPFQALASDARAAGRGAAIYKADPAVAAAARRAGWRAVVVAREAWLDPGCFRIERPACAGLRRKLRHAAKAEVMAQAEAPVAAELARINVDWVATHGAERGFSMGRFEPGYLAGQRLYVARIGAQAVGFASFHVSDGEWALDLLRPHPAAPDGVAHALVAAALADAQRAGVPRLSLAAVPEAAFADGQGIAARLGRRIKDSGTGLLQFKAAFAPRWQRLYLVAPGWLALGLAALDIRRAVLRPVPLAAPSPPPAEGPENGFASPGDAWQRKAG
ncbi:phosphatidylglycerol lysyltransferase domain-containing protein [Rhodobacter sp. Har01]|uniref:phosphatidylglycerol lysyltransferase domain-containing protein n=1 Tax=Rhodobacter sp. Har01 TaxID=2883999 RepID=UPI001D0737EE|nr:phosphatidylglycerol lysyltransferase domain-containing protein [Rhodobacter sp. Har01]MCB6176655.1 phosphatidylglycerol lysyltransferase domain-containing protein [Rhodobacter sp. Har01]